MRCVYCGAEVDDNSNECNSCGKPVKKFVGYERETKIIEKAEKTYNEKPISKKAIVIIVTILVVLAIVAIIVQITTSNKDKSSSSFSSTGDIVVDAAMLDLQLSVNKILTEAGCASYHDGGFTIGKCEKQSRGEDNYLVTISGSYYPKDDFGNEHKIEFRFEVTVVNGSAISDRCIMADKKY